MYTEEITQKQNPMSLSALSTSLLDFLEAFLNPSLDLPETIPTLICMNIITP